MIESKFKDLPVPAYFAWENTYYTKIARSKIRRVWNGQDLSEFYKIVNESN